MKATFPDEMHMTARPASYAQIPVDYAVWQAFVGGVLRSAVAAVMPPWQRTFRQRLLETTRLRGF